MIFFSSSTSVIRSYISIDPGGMISLHGLVMFVGASCDIKSSLGLEIATDPGRTKFPFWYCDVCWYIA